MTTCGNMKSEPISGKPRKLYFTDMKMEETAITPRYAKIRSSFKPFPVA